MRFTFILSASLVLTTFGSLPASAQSLTAKLQRETAGALADSARKQGDAARGAVLFAEQRLGCANCHSPGRNDLLGPDLTRPARDVTDVSIVESLLAPSKTIRKGFEIVTVVTEDGRNTNGRVLSETATTLVLRDTTPERRVRRIATAEIELRKLSPVSGMPEKLADQLQDRQQFLDLIRYVMELVAAGPSSDRHTQTQSATTLPDAIRGHVLLNEYNCRACHSFKQDQTPLPAATAPNLQWLGGRVDPQYISRFLSKPHAVKPDTQMPDLLAALEPKERDEVATALTHYIMSLGSARPDPVEIADDARSRGRELFHSVGCVACHSPRDEQDRELLPENSVSLAGLNKYGIESLVEFLKDPHAARPAGRMPNMQLSHWEAIDLAAYLLQDSTTASRSAALKPNARLVESGRTHFTKLGCANCHSIPSQQRRERIGFSKIPTTRGCLSNRSGAWPLFRMEDADRQAIEAALAGNPALSDSEVISASMVALRCVNCHDRSGLGGVPDDRNAWFTTTNPNLGPQGRMPPTLTGIGAKLKPTWLRQVLVSGRSIRPYVKTRMPRFGAENVVHLVDRFHSVDKQPALPPVEFADQKEIRNAGLELAGTRGLNCIVCHTFQLKPAATMPAVDLTEMTERLQKDWFHRYMRAPQRFSANTVMPSFWPGGRAIRRDVLGGDPDLQVEALWQYLLDGRQARAPHGLIREPMELLATDEAVMLRRSYPGVGKRGIGVGYPAEMNLVFDAEQLQLAMLWRGKFADPGGVWRSQGHGSVRPLSRKVIRFAKGPDIDEVAAEASEEGERPPRHRFRGYSLDEKQRPKFRYTIGNTEVEDYAIDVANAQQPTLRRTLTIRGAAGKSLIFRVADGEQIAKNEDGFVIDKQLWVRIPTSQTARIANASERQRLVISISPEAAETVITVEYTIMETSR